MRSGGFHAGPPGVPAEKAVNAQKLIDGPIARTLAVFALPLLATNLLQSVSGTSTAIWVSHVLGPNALTAVVNANVFIFMIMGAVMGVGIAAGIAIGQSVGEGSEQAVKRIVGSAIGFALLISVPLATLGIVFAPAIIDLARLPDLAREPAIIYFSVSFLSMPTLFTFIFLNMMLRGFGDPRTPFRFTLLWIGLSIVLSPLLLTGAFGFPKLGIAGAALGGIIANVIALVGLVWTLYAQKSPFALRGPELRYLKPNPSLLLMLVRNGLPMAMETIIVQGAYFVLLAMVNDHGAVEASAYSGAAQLWGYVQMPAIAIAGSMSAMAAVNIGAGRWDRVEQIALKGCLLSGTFTFAMTMLIYGLGQWPLKLFLPQGGEALTTAQHINAIALWGWIVLSVTSGLSAIVRANAAMLAPTIIFAITMWIFRVPFASFLQPVMGSDAIWWSFPIGSISSALLAYAYFKWGGWRKNKLMMRQTAVETDGMTAGH